MDRMAGMDLSQFGTWEQMTGGSWHLPGVTEEVAGEHARGFRLVRELNKLGNTDPKRTAELLRELLPEDSEVFGLHTPVAIEYARNLHVGKNVFINFNATILAQAPVTLGDGVMIGPNCSLITVGHPVNDHEMRAGGWEIARPITVGRNTWFGANVTVMPGVTIGENCVIGACTLVTRDVPDNSLLLGQPGRVVRQLDDASRWERADLDGPVEGYAAGQDAGAAAGDEVGDSAS